MTNKWFLGLLSAGTFAASTLLATMPAGAQVYAAGGYAPVVSASPISPYTPVLASMEPPGCPLQGNGQWAFVNNVWVWCPPTAAAVAPPVGLSALSGYYGFGALMPPPTIAVAPPAPVAYAPVYGYGSTYGYNSPYYYGTYGSPYAYGTPVAYTPPVTPYGYGYPQTGSGYGYPQTGYPGYGYPQTGYGYGYPQTGYGTVIRRPATQATATRRRAILVTAIRKPDMAIRKPATAIRRPTAP